MRKLLSSEISLNQKRVFNIFVSFIHIYIIQKVLKFYLYIYIRSWASSSRFGGNFISLIYFQPHTVLSYFWHFVFAGRFAHLFLKVSQWIWTGIKRTFIKTIYGIFLCICITANWKWNDWMLLTKRPVRSRPIYSL